MKGQDILKQIVVRISRNGKVGDGTGFYINENEIATCFHVLAREKEVLQECYYIKHDEWMEWREAEPLIDLCNLTTDIAILRCSYQSNQEIKIPFDVWDKKTVDFLSRGYDCNMSPNIGATNVTGKIQSQTSKREYPRLQLQTTKGTLRLGRSGSPIWSNNAIVGMIDYHAGGESIETDKSTAIPIEEFKQKVLLIKAKQLAIPIVIIAMNKEEACKLKDGKLIDNEKEPLFRQFTDALQEYKITNWESLYDESREKWRPLICEGETIDTIIIKILDKINQDRHESTDSPAIEWTILSNEFFNSEKQRKREIYSELSKFGGILIIDSISLFHPEIRESLISSQLFSDSLLNEKLYVLIISPIDHRIVSPNYIIESLIDSKMPPTIIDKDFVRLDNLCISDSRILQRKLSVALPEAEKNVKQQQIIKNRNNLQEHFGRKPSRIDQPIFRGNK